jgi:23S rRNA (adenine2503-C2)-methyltransferase
MAGAATVRDLGGLRERLRALGAAPTHEAHMLRGWLGQPVRRRDDDFLPRALREARAEIEAELAALATLREDHPAADGSRRLLVGLADGRTVEAVLLPRGGLCVSSQVGCAVGCGFCATGTFGLERHLGSAEIVAQVALARRLRAVDKVVFMGMGEPAHNLDAVLEAIELLGSLGGIGHKRLVFSTVGDRRAFDRLQGLPEGRVRPALALSLHTTDAALRRRLMPRAPDIAPDVLVELGDAYVRATGYPMQVQWTLLEGVNDTAEEIDGIVRLLGDRYAVLNLIPWNAVDGMPWRRPAPDRERAMARELQRRGVLTKLRQSAGQDVEAGCGQLHARHARPESPLRRIALTRADGARRAAT